VRGKIHITAGLGQQKVRKGIFLVLLHVTRVPPHIGIMIDDQYHSLAIKGRELNVRGEVLLKNISVRKIPSIFIEIEKHPVFSNDHLGECFAEEVKQFDRVAGDVTCLSPVKLFFSEFYAIQKDTIELVFDLLEELEKNHFIKQSFGVNLGTLKENNFYLQQYNRQDLDAEIREETAKLKK
jgi:hypothetical protein